MSGANAPGAELSGGAGGSTVTYGVTAPVPTTTVALTSGARAQVAIVTATVANGLLVPLSALTRTGGEPGRYRS